MKLLFSGMPRSWFCAVLITFAVSSVALAASTGTTPSAPTITQHVKGISQVSLAWTKLDGVSSYNVYSSGAPGGAATSATPLLSGITDSKTVVLGLPQGDPIYFVVRGVTAGKPGAASAEVSETPGKDARPADLKTTAKDGSVTLTWISIGASSYSVSVGTSYQSLSMLPDLSAVPGDSVTVQGLTNDVTYLFLVKASNGTQSDVVGATPRSKAAPPLAAGSSMDRASCVPAEGSASETTLHQQGLEKTSNVSGADVFSKFSTTATSGSTQATVQIVSGHINAWMKSDPSKNCGITNAISVEVTATAAITTANFADYAREELLGRRSGIVNIYFNPFAGRDVNNPYYQWNGRQLASDHIYVKLSEWGTVDRSLKEKPKTDSSDEALTFLSFGIGGRGIKTASTGTSLSALGTTYVGFGIDGPFHTDPLTGAANSSGGLSFEVYATGNFANRNTLDTMFNTTQASKTYGTYGATLTLWATGKLFFSLEYDKGLGNFGQHVLKDASLFRFGYGNSSKNPSTATPPPAANKPGS